jgi:hypothetical protein
MTDPTKPNAETPKPETQAAARGAREFAEFLIDSLKNLDAGLWSRGGVSKDEFITHFGKDIAARDARRDADAQKIGETVALREALEHIKLFEPTNDDEAHYQRRIIDIVTGLIPSDGQSLVDKHDAQIRAETLRDVIGRLRNHAIIHNPKVKLAVQVCIEQVEALIPIDPAQP